ncbi:MAG: right-handed parallel beta-helix repeat-containing protein [Candidatus Latescibacterota bacterium]|nr:MAG: right-handed parallel beta-helix repeat-containing protein [Candidatus Latescibacterota bacterium]
MSRLGVVVALALCVQATASARTLRVSPGGSVTAAVNSASEGDTVLVEPGTYQERFSLSGKDIVLRGEMGAEVTTIHGRLPNQKGNVLTFEFVTRNMVIEDLTITGGLFNDVHPESVGTAIYINRGSPTIQRCILRDNDANAGGGVAAYFFSKPLIRDCWVGYNKGGGIFVETHDGDGVGDVAEIYNTYVVRNTGFGISAIKGAEVIVENCTVAYNSGDGVRAEITSGFGAAKTYVTVRNSIITDNNGGGIIRHDVGVCFTLGCNDVWNNQLGEWVGTNPGDPCFPGRGGGSNSIEPVYVDVGSDNFLLAQNSPLFGLCVPGGCGALGAENECSTSVSRRSWSRIKELYR